MLTKKEAIKMGRRGERNIRAILKAIPYSNVISNVYLRNKNTNSSTEIDMVMVHPTGIYVIESKNYGGYISYKSPKPNMWCQTYSNGMKRLFYNPVMQNEGHIRWLIQHFKWEQYGRNLPIYSYIVFGENAKLPCPYVTGYLKVISVNDLQRVIVADIRSRRAVLNVATQQMLIKDLTKNTRVSSKVKKDHIKQVNRIKRKGM